jgi:beta-glucosidase
MMRSPLNIICLIAIILSINTFSQETEKFRDPSFPVEERVDDLLGRMTIDEKLTMIGGS